MNLGFLHLPTWGRRRAPHLHSASAGNMKLCYSDAVRTLPGQHKIGFAMLSTLEQDVRRTRPHHGAILSKMEFFNALQNKDLKFIEVSNETGLYFLNKADHSEHRQRAMKELAALDYLIFFGVTYEQMPGNSNVYLDTLRPRLYNNEGQLVKRLDECYWSDSTIPVELDTYINALAESIRMEIRIIIRRMEAIVK